MALQTSIAQYFSNRKRQLVEEGKRNVPPNKVLIVDQIKSDVSSLISLNDGSPRLIEKKVCHTEAVSVNRKTIVPVFPKQPKKTPKTSNLKKKEKTSRSGSQPDIRRSLLPEFHKEKHTVESKVKEHCQEGKKEKVEANIEAIDSIACPSTLKEEKDKPNVEVSQDPVAPSSTSEEEKETTATLVTEDTVVVPFIVNSILSPKKKKSVTVGSQISNVNANQGESSKEKPVQKLNALKKELGLGSVKSRLCKSSRFGEIQAALQKIKKGHEKLDEISSKIPPKSPVIGEFKKIHLEIPSSPSKSVPVSSGAWKSPSRPTLLQEAILRSPVKASLAAREALLGSPLKAGGGAVPASPIPAPLPYVSPRKLLEEFGKGGPSKPPAFARLSALASPDGKAGGSSLPLPYKYRMLAETFRSVDTVVSIMFNRNETIAFTRLKHSVQELSKRNLYESHIGQILVVLPGCFSLHLEKIRHFGSNLKSEKPELVLVPVLENLGGDSCAGERMTPSALLQRRRKFYQALLSMAKEHHKEFLSKLDPPMEVPDDRLKRWHPDFDLEGVPDIEPVALPRPPESDKFSTARDVLNKAKEMLMVNPRMEKALQRLSENESGTPAPPPKPIPALANALKGIPKSLLEKVRARQAAKAVELLTREVMGGSEGGKGAADPGRLPALARILRALFVGERRAALPLHTALDKLRSSYNETLSPGEMEQHLTLLVESVSGWLTIHTFEKQTFLKMNKNLDMAKVMDTLNDLASKSTF